MNKLLLFVFSKLPILSLLDGHKRTISRIVLLLGALLPVLQQHFPQVHVLGELNSYVLLVAGWLGLELGNAHAKAKDS